MVRTLSRKGGDPKSKSRSKNVISEDSFADPKLRIQARYLAIDKSCFR